MEELVSVSAPVLPLDPIALEPPELIPELLEPLLPKPVDPEPSLELEPPLRPDRPLEFELPSEPELLPPEEEPDFEPLRLLRQSVNSSENLRYRS